MATDSQRERGSRDPWLAHFLQSVNQVCADERHPQGGPRLGARHVQLDMGLEVDSRCGRLNTY